MYLFFIGIVLYRLEYFWSSQIRSLRYDTIVDFVNFIT